MNRRLTLALTAGFGLLLFVWQLGSTGLVDETPPRFAAAARAMAEGGGWLIPQVNGLPRYDKPPLVYWLMALGYALPGQAQWNPLGTWAARLPSALATVGLMLALADTLLRWPQPPAGGASGQADAGAAGPEAPAGAAPAALAGGSAARSLPRRSAGGDGPGALGAEAAVPARGALTALGAALAFGLSPLVLLWGRIAVSDALFTALVGLTLLLGWRRYAAARGPAWPIWLALALAILTKGPAALLLCGLSWLLFGLLQRDLPALLRSLRIGPGLLLTAAVSLPWYGAALVVEGRPFWDSFFGYHNLQRFTQVVNHHLQPWWFYGPVLLLASLPVSPLLLLGLGQGLALGPGRCLQPLPAAASLGRYAACWLLAILLFFTAAATKLPSYWLPATPAAALLVALAARRPAGLPEALQPASGADGALRRWRLAWGASLLLALLLGLAFALAPLWLPLIREPELPGLAEAILRSGHVPAAAACWLMAGLLPPLLRRARASGAAQLLALQLPLVLFMPLALLPLWSVGDGLRGAPVRSLARAVRQELRAGESVAMVGILKPSLHYYARRVVLYEGVEPEGPLNLADRLRRERRHGQIPSTPEQRPSLLVVIDQRTAASAPWRDLGPTEIGRAGIYRLWRLERARLEARAAALRQRGLRPTWNRPRPERY